LIWRNGCSISQFLFYKALNYIESLINSADVWRNALS